jgi:hypothetical protein
MLRRDCPHWVQAPSVSPTEHSESDAGLTTLPASAAERTISQRRHLFLLATHGLFWLSIRLLRRHSRVPILGRVLNIWRLRRLRKVSDFSSAVDLQRGHAARCPGCVRRRSEQASVMPSRAGVPAIIGRRGDEALQSWMVRWRSGLQHLDLGEPVPVI